MKRSIKHSLATLLCCSLWMSTSVSDAANKNIVEAAASHGSFTTLVAALQAAELAETLQQKGPFTVFAPSDEAFANLPAGTVETLLKPANRGRLVNVLTYHVAAGSIPAKSVVAGKAVTTLNGQRIAVTINGQNVTLDNAKVLTTDIQCSNGIIHVIDRVILPSSDNLVEVAQKAETFQTLLAAAEAAGLVDALQGAGPLTVFAPTDEAFQALPKGTVASLLKPANKQQLVQVLKHHVVPGRVYSEEALALKKIETLNGTKLHFASTDGAATINQAANLVTTDIQASNGVIHVIDRVLLPKATKKISAAGARKMIRDTVARGTRTFNAGDHHACAELYLNTMREMVEYGDQMPASVRHAMQRVLAKAHRTDCPTEKSWTLRHGLDYVYARMSALR